MTDEKPAKQFADGIMFKKPHEKAPDFVKGKISVDLERFYTWAKDHVNHKGWLDLDLKKSSKGNLYLELNAWKPKVDATQGEVEDPKF